MFGYSEICRKIKNGEPVSFVNKVPLNDDIFFYQKGSNKSQKSSPHFLREIIPAENKPMIPDEEIKQSESQKIEPI